MSSCPTPIRSKEDAMKLKGIGEFMAHKIESILQKANLLHVEPCIIVYCGLSIAAVDSPSDSEVQSPRQEPLGYIPRAGGRTKCYEVCNIVSHLFLISLALAVGDSSCSSSDQCEVEAILYKLAPSKQFPPKKLRETATLLHRKGLFVSASSPFSLTDLGKRTALKCLQLSRLQYPLVETFLQAGGARRLAPLPSNSTVSTVSAVSAVSTIPANSTAVSTVSTVSTVSPLVLPHFRWPLAPPPAGQRMGEPCPVTDPVSPVSPVSPFSSWVQPVRVEGDEADWEVVLVLDNREVRSQQDRAFLANQLHAAGLRCEVRALGLGDVQWTLRHRGTGREAMLDVVVERKNARDLAQSILDGRFREQQFRLGRCGARHPVYLVEGGLATQDVLPTDSLMTGMMRTVVNQDIYVYQSTSIDDSIVFLRSLHEIEKAAVHRYFEEGDEWDYIKEYDC